MTSPRQSCWRPAFGLFMLVCLMTLSGCSGETSAPTTIHEGGGTIPEIVDQPEPSAKQPSTGAPKK